MIPWRCCCTRIAQLDGDRDRARAGVPGDAERETSRLLGLRGLSSKRSAPSESVAAS